MTRVSIRIEADCPGVFDIVDRAKALDVLSCTALPFRPSRPGDTGGVWLSDWQENGFDPAMTPKMVEALGDTPYRLDIPPYLN